MRNIIKTKNEQWPRQKAIKYILVFIVVFSAIWCCWSYFFSSVSNSEFSEKVLVVNVSKQPSVTRGNGKVVPVETHVVSAAETGVVSRMVVEQGQSISQGEPLAQLYNAALIREYNEVKFTANDVLADVAYRQSQLKLEQAAFESELSKAESTLKKYLLELSASKKLSESGIVSKIKYEQLTLTVEQAKLDVENLSHRLLLFKDNFAQQSSALNARKQAALEKVNYFEQRIESLTIKSPISGIVKSLALEPGETVVEGARLLEVVNHHNLVAAVSVPQYMAHEIRTNSLATIKTPSGSLEGTVSFVDPIVRQGAVAVRIALPKPLPHWLSIEQSVEATISTSAVSEVVSVDRPEDYIEGESWMVYRQINGKSIQTEIEVLYADKQHVFLSSGLVDGEHIVLVQSEKNASYLN